MSNKNINALLNLKPTIFSPSVTRTITDGSAFGGAYSEQNSSVYSNTMLGDSGSFRYDPQGTGLKSTQQLQVDWTQFSNHTFFNSAQVKVNAAFEKILNFFPIDGTQKEYEKFFDGLTGFEKYVYDIFPKFKNYLFLSRSLTPANGTYVSVKDSAGAAFPASTKNLSGKALLNPGLESCTFETWLYLPAISNQNNIIFQKLSSDLNYYGFSMYASASISTDFCTVGFNVVSGNYVLDTSASLKKGIWNHVAVVWDRNPSEIKSKIFINNQFISQSAQVDIGILNFDSANLFIGSGSSFPVSINSSGIADSFFYPSQTLSGAMDEFRIWHSIRTDSQRAEFSVKNVFSQDDLALYFKFNEPSGSLSTIVIDSSGKALHGQLFGVNLGIRNISGSNIAGASPVTYEKDSQCPALLPDYKPIDLLRQKMLVEASQFDQENPNLIIKLVPAHYFAEGKEQDALDTDEGTITSDLDNTLTPNSTKLGNTQILLMLLYTWATFLDEIKLYMDAFVNTIHVDYNNADTVADQFLQFLSQKHGIQLPPMFTGSSIDQFINAENIQTDYSNEDYGLQYIQNQIWRRILINLKDIVSSKGTIHSVKSYIRSIGIEPDNYFRIREYGGPTTKALKISRESKSENSTMLSFLSGGLVRSPYLSGSRVEPGFPQPLGSFLTNSNGVNVGTSQAGDGLLTSGSWTYEGIYSLNSNFGDKQSLVRMNVSGSVTQICLLNVVAYNSGGVKLFCGPNEKTTSIPMSMSIDANLFDGSIWSLSFGKIRSDDLGITSPSSSYFLRAAKQNYGQIIEEHTASVYYNEYNTGSQGSNMWNSFNSGINAFGAWIEIGSSSVGLTSGLAPGLNNTTFFPDDARLTTYNGKISQIRFWSKALDILEWREHVRNFKSIGVIDPTTNFNFGQKLSGSFEKIRIDASTDQQQIGTDIGGNINIFDFSQNNFHLSGTNFAASSSVILPQIYHYSLISPHFDESATENKIRIRSFLNLDNLMNSEENYAEVAPYYEIRKSEEPQDNTRFTVDFSMVEALNQDIINIFATLDEFDNAIGSPALVFSPDYPTLSFLRSLYFNRLTDNLKLKNFYDFYRWLDVNCSSFIAQLLPRKTKFDGTSFVMQSHMLERAKFEYQFYEQYLGDNIRDSQRDTILIQELTGIAKKY